MSTIEWSSFANQHSLITIACLILGGLISLIENFKWWFIGIYSIFIAFLMFTIEYPRSAKPIDSSNLSHTPRPRPCQRILEKVFLPMRHFYANYLYRFLIYFTLCIPCFLTLSSFIAGLNLLITAVLYLISYFRKEKWLPIDYKREVYKEINVIRAPERPPPRTLSELEQ